MSKDKIQFSIAIPTFRRPDILKRCLDSLDEQVEKNQHDVMVLDNDQDEDIRKLVDSYGREDFRYIASPILGVSASRNLALQSSSFDWLIFLDDDAFVREDFTKVVSEFIEKNPDVGCFGGEIHSLFDSKPFWMPRQFESMLFEKTDSNVVENINVNSGALAVDLRRLGTVKFDENQGMKGVQLGYGADTMFVQNLLQNEVQIGHCKEWKVDHLVRPEKTSISWLNNSWQQRASTYNRMYNPDLMKSLTLFFRNLIGLVTILPLKSIFMIFRDKEKTHLYSFRYFRNFIISSYILRNSLKRSLKF